MFLDSRFEDATPAAGSHAFSCAKSKSSLSLLRLFAPPRQQNQIKSKSKMRPTTPPTTPPAMAPTLVLEDLLTGRAVAEVWVEKGTVVVWVMVEGPFVEVMVLVDDKVDVLVVVEDVEGVLVETAEQTELKTVEMGAEVSTVLVAVVTTGVTVVTVAPCDRIVDKVGRPSRPVTILVSVTICQSGQYSVRVRRACIH